LSRLSPFEENTIVVGDCLDIMAQMPDGCVDLVVTSPPYWDLIDYGMEKQVGYGQSLEDYIQSLSRVVLECYRIAPWAVINIGDKEIEPSAPLHSLLVASLPIWPWQILIWWKRNNTPYNIPQKLHPKHEYCLVFGPGGTFNEDNILQPYSEATLKDKRPYKGHRVGANPGTVWDIPAYYGRRGHGGTFPYELPSRFIRLYSNPGDLIFDPFMGSGTTAVVADRLGRKFFGCDINPDYVEMALKRLEKDRAGRQLQLL